MIVNPGTSTKVAARRPGGKAMAMPVQGGGTKGARASTRPAPAPRPPLAERLDRQDRRQARMPAFGRGVASPADLRQRRLVEVARSHPIDAASDRQREFARDKRAQKALDAHAQAGELKRRLQRSLKQGALGSAPVAQQAEALRRVRDAYRAARAAARVRPAREILG